jgi:capsular exopolysaccharide synthesis family protein
MDMRRGTLRQRLNQPRRRGLSDLLAGQIKESRILPVENINNLWYMQAGSAPPNPAELLGETLFAEWLAIWRSQYDVVLLDSPPLLPVTDTHIVRPLVDVTLLLARARHTERRQLRRALEMVETGKGAKVGIILNGIHQGDESYYEYHGYKQYAYQRVPGARTHA